MSDDALDRRFPRRLLLGGGAAAAALAALETVRPTPAAAAPPTSAWLLGGNAGVTNDGTNFLGPTNPAPLIIKTRRTASTPMIERMRVTPTGAVGVGTKGPVARLDVLAVEAIGVQSKTSDDSGAGVAVRGEVTVSGCGVRGIAAAGTGVRGDGGTNGYGLFGNGGYCGAQAEGGFYGGIFYGDDNGSYGAYASGQATGVYASGGTIGVQATGPTAVRAVGSTSGTGVYASGATGVYGSGSGTGVYGNSTDTGGGRSVWGAGGQYGVYGSGGRTGGVRGDSGYVGIWGEGAVYGAFGVATGTTGANYGLLGRSASPDGYAMYAEGNARVTGTLSKAAGSFRIDHPLDPDHRWLSHSFVESPDMMNVYNGNVVLGAGGTATVVLPDYFHALNREFRYQLTCIGGHAPVYVAREVADGRFEIAGGSKGLKVSWQVTGIRQDDYAKAHPIVVDVAKTGAEKGTRQFVPAGVRATAFSLAPAAGSGTAKTPTVPADPPVPTPER